MKDLINSFKNLKAQRDSLNKLVEQNPEYIASGEYHDESQMLAVEERLLWSELDECFENDPAGYDAFITILESEVYDDEYPEDDTHYPTIEEENAQINSDELPFPIPELPF